MRDFQKHFIRDYQNAQEEEDIEDDIPDEDAITEEWHLPY